MKKVRRRAHLLRHLHIANPDEVPRGAFFSFGFKGV